MWKSYQFIFENNKLVILKNRKPPIIIAIIMASVSAVLFLFLSKVHPYMNLREWPGWMYVAFSSLTPLLIIVKTLREKDIEIIRHSDTTFDFNGERLSFDKNVDHLEVVEEKVKSTTYYRLTLNYGDQKMVLINALNNNEREEHVRQIADFLKLAVRDY